MQYICLCRTEQRPIQIKINGHSLSKYQIKKPVKSREELSYSLHTFFSSCSNSISFTNFELDFKLYLITLKREYCQVFISWELQLKNLAQRFQTKSGRIVKNEFVRSLLQPMKIFE